MTKCEAVVTYENGIIALEIFKKNVEHHLCDIFYMAGLRSVYVTDPRTMVRQKFEVFDELHAELRDEEMIAAEKALAEVLHHVEQFMVFVLQATHRKLNNK